MSALRSSFNSPTAWPRRATQIAWSVIRPARLCLRVHGHERSGETGRCGRPRRCPRRRAHHWTLYAGRSRAEAAPIEIGDINTVLEAEWALPMLHRGTLAGFVLIGGKSNNETYRPDEIDVLAFATHQLTLDLVALRVEQLEQQSSLRAQDSAVLRDQLKAAMQCSKVPTLSQLDNDPTTGPSAMAAVAMTSLCSFSGSHSRRAHLLCPMQASLLQ